MKRIQHILLIACVLLAGLAAWRFISFGIVKVMYPYALNLGESALGQTIHFFKQGIWPYRELTSAPYTLVPYGPVYLILSSLIQYLTDMPFVGGRVVTGVSTVLASVGIFLVLRRSRVSPVAGIIAAGLFLSLRYIDRWGVQVNVDMTGVMFEIMAVYFFLSRKTGWGILFQTTAFFTKSSCVAGGAAFFLWKCIQGKWKEAFQYALIQGGVILGIYGLLNVLTHGRYYFHTTYEISQRLFFARFIHDYWIDAVTVIPLLCLSALALALSRFIRREHMFLCLYLFVTALLTFSLGKQGSDTNYFLAFCASSSLAVGLLLGEGLREHRKILVIVLCGLTIAQFAHGGVLRWNPMDYQASMNVRKEFYDKVSVDLKKIPDPILMWDMSLLLANNKLIYFEPFPMAQMSYSGVWDEEYILKDLRNKKFTLAVLYFFAPILGGDRNFTPGFLKVFKSNYHLIGTKKIPWNEKELLFFYAPNPKN